MKKLLFAVLFFVLFTLTAHGYTSKCNTIYNTIGGNSYYSGLHCEYNIRVSEFSTSYPEYSSKTHELVNVFVIQNGHKIKDFATENQSCEGITQDSIISDIESTIAAQFDGGSSDIESRETSLDGEQDSIVAKIEELNDKTLYYDMQDQVKEELPHASTSILNSETKIAYYEKQDEIIDEIKQQQIDYLLEKNAIKITKKHLDILYNKVESACGDMLESSTEENDESEDEENENSEEETHEDSSNVTQSGSSNREVLTAKYKTILADKLSAKLEKIADEKLEKLVVIIDKYIARYEAKTTLSAASKDKQIAKLEALKQVINDRLDPMASLLNEVLK